MERAHPARSETGRILVVDDEANVADVVAGALRLVGYQTETAPTGYAALAAADRHEYLLIVLDVGLPDVDGFEVCRRLRSDGIVTPILFLTARTGAADAARGLALGADDYIRKPFGLEELVARVRTVLRRASQHSSTDDDDDILRFDDIEIDRRRYEARRAGSILDLTPSEFRVLETLVDNAGRILTRGQILDAVWDEPEEREPTSVETTVSRLRRKLNAHGPGLIETRRGVGYGLLRRDR